jgi:hypothetical protein
VHLGDERGLIELRRKVMRDSTGRFALHARVGGDRNDQVHIALLECVGKHLRRVPRLRGRIAKSARREAVHDGRAVYPGAGHQQQCENQYSSWRHRRETHYLAEHFNDLLKRPRRRGAATPLPRSGGDEVTASLKET